MLVIAQYTLQFVSFSLLAMVVVFLQLVTMTKMMMRQTWFMKELIREWMRGESCEGNQH